VKALAAAVAWGAFLYFAGPLAGRGALFGALFAVAIVAGYLLGVEAASEHWRIERVFPADSGSAVRDRCVGCLGALGYVVLEGEKSPAFSAVVYRLRFHKGDRTLRVAIWSAGSKSKALVWLRRPAGEEELRELLAAFETSAPESVGS
jgi:hypothetical protein